MTPDQEQAEKKRAVTEFVYQEYDWMNREVMQKLYPEFNDRTLKQFLDDSQKRANGYVYSRESQDKEPWQANVFTGTTRNKTRAYVGSVSKTPPQLRMVATDSENRTSAERAEVMQNLIKHSYLYCQNPEKDIFDDGWDCAIDGTIVKQDGYMLIKDEVEVVKSYDPTTGKIEVEKSEQVIEDRPFEQSVNVNDFLIRDPFCSDVQEQPAVIMAQRMTLDDFMYEFGKYPDAKLVKTYANITEGERDLFFGPKWSDQVNKDRVLVLRYYRKKGDKKGYKVVANGVLIVDSPLLWGRKKKFYPFAKTVFEPFANRKFFWGNSLPNVMMAHQDTENSLVNSMLDKTTRSVEQPMLVSMENKDSLELEDEFVTGDTRIYVNDINGVKPMPVAGVTRAEISMLNDVSQRLSLASVDALQEGYSQSGVTAREIVIANERSAEIKGIFFMLLSDLWLQKMRLRTLSIIMFYQRVGKRYNVPNVELSGGQQGTLQVRVGDEAMMAEAGKTKGYSPDGKPFNALDVEEAELSLKGTPTEILIIPPDYLDDWEYELEIMTETVYQRGKSLDMALENEKLTTVSTLFPEIFMANKAKFFSRLIRNYGDAPEAYDMAEAAPGAMPGAPGQMPTPVMDQVGAPAKSLPALAGMAGT